MVMITKEAAMVAMRTDRRNQPSEEPIINTKSEQNEVFCIKKQVALKYESHGFVVEP